MKMRCFIGLFLINTLQTVGTLPCLAQNKDDFTKSVLDFFSSYPNVALRDYKPGMRFVVSPINWDKEDQFMKNFYIAAEYDPKSGKPTQKRTRISHKQLSGKAIKLIDVVERKPAGNLKTYFVFEVQGFDYLVEYELDFQLSNPKPPKQTAIEYLCYYDEIEALANDLVGRQVFLRSNTIHYLDPKTKIRKSAMYSQNFLTARIEKIEPWFGGTAKIGFTTEQGDYGEVEIIISGTNLFDKPKNAHHFKFERHFLFENPKFNFDSQTWKRIEKGEIWKGMSATQARLAAGEPDSIQKNGNSQTWLYKNRKLIFRNETLVGW